MLSMKSLVSLTPRMGVIRSQSSVPFRAPVLILRRCVRFQPAFTGFMLHQPLTVPSRLARQQKNKTTVLRRYSDFASLHELLSARFTYRVIPRLPPKRVGASKEFIEHRKKCLHRYMNIVSRHPQIHDDKLLIYFLTFTGKDVKNKLKEYFRNIPDEFMTSYMTSSCRNPVSIDAEQQLANSKEHITFVFESISVLKDITERMVCRLTSFSSDMLQMGKQFSNLSNDSTSHIRWTAEASQSWARIQNGLKHLSIEFASLANKSTLAAVDEEDGVVEKLSFYQDLLTAYRDLCERHEKGVLNDHQKALQKIDQFKKKRTAVTEQSTKSGIVEELEQKILEQENQISSLENRSIYSMYCLQMETQFVHAHLEIFYEFVSCMAKVEASLNSDLSRIWTFMAPVIASLSSSNQPSSPTSHLAPMGSHTASNKILGYEF